MISFPSMAVTGDVNLVLSVFDRKKANQDSVYFASE